jgi:hypothetical protein
MPKKGGLKKRGFPKRSPKKSWSAPKIKKKINFGKALAALAAF